MNVIVYVVPSGVNINDWRYNAYTEWSLQYNQKVLIWLTDSRDVIYILIYMNESISSSDCLSKKSYFPSWTSWLEKWQTLFLGHDDFRMILQAKNDKKSVNIYSIAVNVFGGSNKQSLYSENNWILSGT